MPFVCQPPPSLLLDAAAPPPGAMIGPYRLVRELGRGGMGIVYLAEQPLLGRQVAIKVARRDLAGVDPDRALVDEARAIGAIGHPGIVTIHDVGRSDDGRPFVVMELLEGVTLRTWLLGWKCLVTAPALALARRITAALAAAHRAGIVHGDLKPENVFLVRDPDGGPSAHVKLVDFGLSMPSSRPAGVVAGTPAYMAPEQCRCDRTPDPRTDLYALGCVLFEMLAGRPPFVGSEGSVLLAGHVHGAPPDVRELSPAVPAPVAGLIARLLAKDPADRPPSAAHVVAELDRLVERTERGTWDAHDLATWSDRTATEAHRAPAPAPGPRRPSVCHLSSCRGSGDCVASLMTDEPRGERDDQGRVSQVRRNQHQPGVG